MNLVDKTPDGADEKDVSVNTEQETVAAPTQTADDVIDIQLETPKKRFRINGDSTQIIELNVGDLNIVSRLKEVYKKLNTLANKAGTLLVKKEGASTEEELEDVSNMLDKLDKDMRELVNYLFDSDVCSVCAKNMHMYSLMNGDFWFERIIEQLAGLYESNFKQEFRKMSEKVHKYTDKYTGR